MEGSIRLASIALWLGCLRLAVNNGNSSVMLVLVLLFCFSGLFLLFRVHAPTKQDDEHPSSFIWEGGREPHC